MPYTTPTPSTVSAGDTFPASAYNIISADLQDHESRIKTGVESYTTTQKNALTSVATGTVVYDSTLGVFQSYTGSAWANLQGTPPSLTTAQKTALGTPATGTMVYDSTLGVLQFWNGSAWVVAQGSPPMLTTAQKTALGTPATGTMVYDSTLGALQTWAGSVWVNVSGTVIAPTISLSGAAAVANTAGLVTFNNVTSISLNNCFTNTYDTHHVFVRIISGTATAFYTYLRSSGSDIGSGNYNGVTLNANTTTAAVSAVTTAAGLFSGVPTGGYANANLVVHWAANASYPTIVEQRSFSGTSISAKSDTRTNATAAHDGISIVALSSLTFSGDIRVIGVA